MQNLSPLFLGLFTALSTLIAELFVFAAISPDSAFYSTSEANTNLILIIGGPWFLFISAFIEEFFKYIFLAKIFTFPVSFKHYFQNILFFSLGFSTIEVTLLIINTPLHDLSMLMHIFGVFLLHFTTIALIGYIINNLSLRKFAPVIVILTMLLHFGYNMIILYQNTLHS